MEDSAVGKFQVKLRDTCHVHEAPCQYKYRHDPRSSIKPDMEQTTDTRFKEESHSEGQRPAAESVKCSPVWIEDVVLNGPAVDVREVESFIHQSMVIIMEDAVKKATDVREKVCEWRSPEQLQDLLDLQLRDAGESKS
ncbi:hypothetical protein LDENG_00072970 [Lucifuga dentata]|nr:hypothetical protein LDENG_00072970 [Lucifuga dentata]